MPAVPQITKKASAMPPMTRRVVELLSNISSHAQVKKVPKPIVASAKRGMTHGTMTESTEATTAVPSKIPDERVNDGSPAELRRLRPTVAKLDVILAEEDLAVLAGFFSDTTGFASAFDTVTGGLCAAGFLAAFDGFVVLRAVFAILLPAYHT
jgi:hypothetical protein